MSRDDAGGPPPTREGIAAGGSVGIAFLYVLLSGPWRGFVFRESAWDDPVTVLGVDTGASAVAVTTVVAAVVAFVTCVRYRRSVDVPAENHRDRLVGPMLLSPVVATLLLVITAVLRSTVRAGGGLEGLKEALYLGSVVWYMVGLFAALSVGVAGAVGVLAGDKFVEAVE